MKPTIIYIHENGYPVSIEENGDEILTNGDNVEISSDFWSYVNNVLENEEEEANEAELLEEFADSMGYELHYKD
jgi:cupin superfamily acireductone dioxygenase involved in methionine salvage